MTDLVNFIRFNEDNSLSGNIASLAYDIDILGEAFESTNAKAPVYRLFAKSPRGRPYAGDPHRDHVHIEMTRKAASHLSLARAKRVLNWQ